MVEPNSSFDIGIAPLTLAPAREEHVWTSEEENGADLRGVKCGENGVYRVGFRQISGSRAPIFQGFREKLTYVSSRTIWKLAGSGRMIETDTTVEERRAKKATRRVKQREITVLRASKMHKARMLAKASGPPPSTPEAPELNIGCSGWFYWHLKGSFYPTQMPTKDWFAHYADHFSTVELNAPFYSWPTPGTVETWRKQALGRDMLYTVKASELITHIKKFAGTKTLVRDFGYIADLLGPLMGCFLFQLPPSYHFTPARLREILGQLDPARRNVIEFRHASWWNDDVYAAFKSAGAIFCSSSAPRLPDDVIKTADDIYIRFHGVERWYRHDYTHDELANWARRIRAVHAKRIWIYFNNDFDGYAIKNATMLADILAS